MERTIDIAGKPTKFKSSGAVPLRYKAQFARDFFIDILSMTGKGGKVDANSINFEVFYNIAWVLAKTADKEIPDLMEWLDSFDAFPIEEVLTGIQDLLTASISTKKN